MQLVEPTSGVEVLSLQSCDRKIDRSNGVNLEKDSDSVEKVTMKGMKIISLRIAESIADTAIRTAISRGYAPVTVVVLDSWGHTVVSKRMDGCAPVGL
jgi:hypothetical protein